MVKMIVLIRLLKKNDEYYLYNYGIDVNNLDGIIKIYLKKGTEAEVIKESCDKNNLATLRAMSKLMKARDNDALSEKLCFQS